MADLGTPSVTSALGLGTADSLINQDISAGKQAATTIKGRDADMEGILKNLSEQKFDKPPPQLDVKQFKAPEMEDPAKAWGSPTTILAMIGSLATRRPLTASLKSATAAMNAVKQGNADQYQMAFDQWKADTDFAFKRATWENDQYKTALDVFNKDFDRGMSMISTYATLNKDTAMQAAIQSGNIGDITSLVNARANLTRAATENYDKLATVGEQVNEWHQWTKQNPNATLDDRVAQHQKIFPSTAGARMFQEYDVNKASQAYAKIFRPNPITGQMIDQKGQPAPDFQSWFQNTWPTMTPQDRSNGGPPPPKGADQPPKGAIPIPPEHASDPDGQTYNGGKYKKQGQYMVPVSQ